MEKSSVIKLILILNLIFISLFAFSSAQDSGEIIKKEIGIDPNKIPTNLDELKEDYLQEKWTEFISKSKILGNLHKFLTKFSFLFIVLFAHPYEISLTLFLIIVLWFFVFLKTTEIINASRITKKSISLVIGAALAIILSHVGILKTLSVFIKDLILKPENWWMRTIIIAITFGVIAVVYVLSSILSRHIKEKAREKAEEESIQKVKEVKGFTKEIKKVKY